jgi:hypothetical protein
MNLPEFEMLRAEHECEQKGMTVPYGPLVDEIRCNRGFADLRGRPDLASKVEEGDNSDALREFLVRLASPDAPYFTVGCDLGSHEEPGMDNPYVAGGYVQIMAGAYTSYSPDKFSDLGQELEKYLHELSGEDDWQMFFTTQPVMFRLDDYNSFTGSMNISFFAAARSPDLAGASRERLIRGLAKALVPE